MDIVPSLVMSLIMFVCVLLIGTINLSPFLLIAIQVIMGILIYLVLSIFFKPRSYILILGKIKELIKK